MAPTAAIASSCTYDRNLRVENFDKHITDYSHIEEEMAGPADQSEVEPRLPHVQGTELVLGQSSFTIYTLP